MRKSCVQGKVNILLLDFGMDLISSVLCFFAGNIPSSGFCPATGSHFNFVGCTVTFITFVTGADTELEFGGP